MKNKVEISLDLGTKVVYSKYAGAELDFDGSSHQDSRSILLWKETASKIRSSTTQVTHASSGSASRRLCVNWTQHSVALVFNICKQASELAHKSIGGFRLDEV